MKPRSLQDARDDMEGPLGIKGELRASTQGLLVLQPWFLGLRLCLVFGGQCCLTAQGAAEPLGRRSVLQKFLRSVFLGLCSSETKRGLMKLDQASRFPQVRSARLFRETGSRRNGARSSTALCSKTRSSFEAVPNSSLAVFWPGFCPECLASAAGAVRGPGSRLEDRRWQGSASRFLALRL